MFDFQRSPRFSKSMEPNAAGRQMEKARGQCPLCGREAELCRHIPNHYLHLILTFLTAGLWIPVWIVLAYRGTCWRCGECGRLAGRGVQGLGQIERLELTPEDRLRISANTFWDARRIAGLVLLSLVFAFLLYLAFKA